LLENIIAQAETTGLAKNCIVTKANGRFRFRSQFVNSIQVIETRTKSISRMNGTPGGGATNEPG
jgi:hypothetical protein